MRLGAVFLIGVSTLVAGAMSAPHSMRLKRRHQVEIPPRIAREVGLLDNPDPSKPGSHLHRVSRASGHAIHIDGGWALRGAYFLELKVGSGTYEVLVDTGSSNLLLGSTECTTCGGQPGSSPGLYNATSPVSCRDPRCSNCNVSPGCTDCAFQNNYCDGTRCGAGITYGGGSSAVMGFLADDTVCGFGDSCLDMQLTAVNYEDPAGSFSFGSKGGGGLVGLAYEFNACNPTCVETVVTKAVQAAGIDDAFAICLTPSSGGRIDLGFVDPSSMAKPMVYTAITHEHWYNFDIAAIGIGSIYASVPRVLFRVTNDVIGSFPDSGTSIVLMGPAIWQGLVSSIKSNYCTVHPGLCEIVDKNCVPAGTIPSVADLPPIFFDVPDMATNGSTNFVLELPATSYIQESSTQQCLLVAPTASLGVILGDTFMQNYYIHHDRANKRLGFSPLAQCN